MNNSKDFLKMDYMDLLFINKNKTYGVYAIKKNYNRTALYAMLIFAGTIGIVAASSFTGRDQNVPSLTRTFSPPPVSLTPPDKIIPPKKEEATESVTRKERATIRNTAPTIAARDKVNDHERNEDPNSETNRNRDISDRNHEGDNSPQDMENPFGNATNGTDKPHTLTNNSSNTTGDTGEGTGTAIAPKVDEKAKPPKNYQHIINQALRYPVLAKSNEIEGTVMLSFVVETDGSVTDIKYEKDPGGGLAEEAVRVIKLLPKFTPAVLGGKPVRSRHRIPIIFSLQRT